VEGTLTGGKLQFKRKPAGRGNRKETPGVLSGDYSFRTGGQITLHIFGDAEGQGKKISQARGKKSGAELAGKKGPSYLEKRFREGQIALATGGGGLARFSSNWGEF